MFKGKVIERSGIFPDLRSEEWIALDTETRDPCLKNEGPGWAWGEGEIVGVAIATTSWSGYWPVAHPDCNEDRAKVFAWLRDQLACDTLPVFMANATYDLGWLRHHGVEVAGPVHDVITMAALLDENRFHYGLDYLGADYLGETKDETGLEEQAAKMNIRPNRIKENLWRMPAQVVSAYAQQDARLTLRLGMKLLPMISEDSLDKVYDVERRLVPVLLDMRSRGVKVDIKRAEEVSIIVTKKAKEAHAKIKWITGKEFVDSGKWMAPEFDKLGIQYPVTEKGNPSFVKDYLVTQQHALCKSILEVRKYDKIKGTFIENAILNHARAGRVYTQFHSTKRDEGGTITGRLSSSDPNMQQVPARDPIMGPLMRGLFLPEDGNLWGSFDYSQQEPRLTVHYANLCALPGAAAAVKYYNEDAKPDYHQMVADMAGIPRPQAKTINLGLAYGMGQKLLAQGLELSLRDAREIIQQYHKRIPYIKGLTDACDNSAAGRGEIYTLLGRKCRFPNWEPALSYAEREELKERGVTVTPQEHTEARRRQSDSDDDIWHGKPLRRAYTWRAMNRLIQGSAADQTKLAMLACYERGYLPHIQVHDELCFSVKQDGDCEEIKALMENVAELSVPTVCDADVGENWGIAKYGPDLYSKAQRI